MKIEGRIRAVSKPNCMLCGAVGAPLYKALPDRFVGTQDKWDLVHCINTKCGLVWLNPMPDETDIGLAYVKYYTHADDSERKGASTVVKKPWFLSLLSRVTGYEARKRRSFLLYLNDREPGRLLEVGCGSGDRLAAFRSIGWDVTGQDVDTRAADGVRKKHGINVLVGPLSEQKLNKNSFDAIAMNHVLEHVHDPKELICECKRLLKPGGLLVIVTPNIQSFGHRVFKSDWVPLDAPRHLYLYTTNALERLMSLNGFQEYAIYTTAINASGHASADSLKYRRETRAGSRNISRFKVKIYSYVFRILEDVLLIFWKHAGEECVAVAQKDIRSDG